jgi:hypothetical protein
MHAHATIVRGGGASSGYTVSHMARVEAEVLGDRELARVYLAATIAEALRVEELLTDRGVDYVVQAEPYGRSLFGSLRVGAVFYVEPAQAGYCGAQFAAAGLARGILVDEDPAS